MNLVEVEKQFHSRNWEKAPLELVRDMIDHIWVVGLRLTDTFVVNKLSGHLDELDKIICKRHNANRVNWLKDGF